MCEVSEHMARTLREIGGSMASVRGAAVQIDACVNNVHLDKYHSIKHY